VKFYLLGYNAMQSVETPDVSDYVTSIFRFEELATQESRMMQGVSSVEEFYVLEYNDM
jgi:hypothetical protein